jgi:hypothetical protein
VLELLRKLGLEPTGHLSGQQREYIEEHARAVSLRPVPAASTVIHGRWPIAENPIVNAPTSTHTRLRLYRRGPGCVARRSGPPRWFSPLLTYIIRRGRTATRSAARPAPQ